MADPLLLAHQSCCVAPFLPQPIAIVVPFCLYSQTFKTSFHTANSTARSMRAGLTQSGTVSVGRSVGLRPLKLSYPLRAGHEATSRIPGYMPQQPVAQSMGLKEGK